MSSEAFRNQTLERFPYRRSADAKLCCKLSLDEPRTWREYSLDNALAQRSIDDVCTGRAFFNAELDEGSGPARL